MRSDGRTAQRLLRHATGLICCVAAIMMAHSANGQASADPAKPNGDAGAAANIPLITDGVVFAPKMGFAKGQTRRYATQASMTLRMAGKGATASDRTFSPTMNLVLQYRIRETKPEGPTQVGVLSEGGQFSNAQGGFDRLPREPETAARLLTLDRQSRIIGFKEPSGHKTSNALDGLFADANLVVPLQILPLPDRPIHVGESWTALYAAPGKSLTASAASDGTEADVKATLTLLGIEKIGEVPTIKLRQVLTVPFVTYTDSQGRPTVARSAKGRMRMLLTFTQMLNALPENGLLVRSDGSMTGEIHFEGMLLAQTPSELMTIDGKFIVVRLEDTAPETAPPSK